MRSIGFKNDAKKSKFLTGENKNTQRRRLNRTFSTTSFEKKTKLIVRFATAIIHS